MGQRHQRNQNQQRNEKHNATHTPGPSPELGSVYHSGAKSLEQRFRQPLLSLTTCCRYLTGHSVLVYIPIPIWYTRRQMRQTTAPTVPAVGEAIRTLRQQQGMSQSELA